MKEDEQASSHSIIVWESNDLQVDIGPAEAPKTSENEKGF